jgi:hypothetical protein
MALTARAVLALATQRSPRTRDAASKHKAASNLKTFGNTTLFSTYRGGGFMQDLVFRELHMSPKAQEEIERNVGQSLPRSGLTKRAV